MSLLLQQHITTPLVSCTNTADSIGDVLGMGSVSLGLEPSPSDCYHCYSCKLCACTRTCTNQIPQSLCVGGRGDNDTCM